MLTETQLDAMHSEPSAALVKDLARLEGDIMILGAGGKVGPTLSRMAARAVQAAGHEKKVYAVSRFSDAEIVSSLEKSGVTCLRCDLSDAEQVMRLPSAQNIVYMAGKKFGTQDCEYETWASNVLLPSQVLHRFQAARYVVFSTGNVYPMTPPSAGGCTEEDAAAPVGEYAMSCLGRERLFEYAAHHYGAKVLLYRLNYAIDLRYGVLCDIGERILSGEPISLANPVFNCVWQGYANEVALRALLLADSPAVRLNVTGPEMASVRQVAVYMGELLGKKPIFQGEEAKTALLSNSGLCMEKFGYPTVSLRQMMHMQAEWLLSNGRLLGKPTHFEEKKGDF